ncbi:MAG: MFS transporter [Desulfobacteraceae bacterium]|nr:MFS transporter [Desulfobacteraceae bacterium]
MYEIGDDLLVFSGGKHSPLIGGKRQNHLLRRWIFIRDNPDSFIENQNEQKVKMWNSMKVVVKKPQSWFLGLYELAIGGAFIAFVGLWGIPFLEDRLNMSAEAAATALIFAWMGFGIGSPVIGWLSDKVNRRCLPLTISALMGVFSSLGLIYLSNLNTAILFVLLFFFGLSASGQALVFAIVRENNHITTTGAANGFNNMAVVLGGVIYLPFIGKFLDIEWTGHVRNGIRVYGVSEYHMALIILPVSFMIAAAVSTFLIRETYCRPLDK